ncbi:MAG TPA: hypothetical protein VGP64_07085 [Polyangia bacterium]|jgi:hypothetical protein
MRFDRLRAGLLAAVVAGAGCSSPQSFIVLVLESSNQTIQNIDHLTVLVTLGTAETQTLTYPAGNLSLTDAAANEGTLSVSFSGNQTGDANFTITAVDGRGCEIGTGMAKVTIRKGAGTEAIVPLAPEMKCTGVDGGAPDLGPGTTFHGCDLTMAATSCPSATETCEINCQSQANVCAAAGSVPAGGACGVDAGCAAGAQCFGYDSLGCKGVAICLRYCAGDNDCAPSAGGVGPGSFCRDPVICGSVTTAYHTCSFSCDPTAAAAAAAATGCPADLACVMPASMDHVDCACPEATRTGKENSACTTTAQCLPGLLCEQTCRAVCHCDAQNGACTAANDCPTAGTTCHVVSGETLYGVCL